jgi:hypothetical protein
MFASKVAYSAELRTTAPMGTIQGAYKGLCALYTLLLEDE